MSAVRGLLFDVKHFAIHDGPGIRTTIFLKGCPLRCLWCHSPESQSFRVEIAFHPDLCIRCGACIEACPQGAVTGDPGRIRRELCNGCGLCSDVCYAGSTVKIGEYSTVDDVLIEVEKDRLLYEASGGGVTISGGEPASQPEFTTGLLKSLKENGFHAALETCGHAEWAILEALMKHTDSVLFDLKQMDPREHVRLTGVSNGLILSNLKRLAGLVDKTLVVRVPVVPGCNDSDANLSAMGEFLGSLGRVEAVELLPYHRLGIPKYEMLGRSYQLNHVQSPTRDHLESIKNMLEDWGLRVVVEGLD